MEINSTPACNVHRKINQIHAGGLPRRREFLLWNWIKHSFRPWRGYSSRQAWSVIPPAFSRRHENFYEMDPSGWQMYEVESAMLSIKDIQQPQLHTFLYSASRAGISNLSSMHVQKKRSTCQLTQQIYLAKQFNVNYAIPINHNDANWYYDAFNILTSI